MSGGLDSINVGGLGRSSGLGTPSTRAGGSTSVSFSDVLKGQIDEVARLQQDASQAVEDLTLGKTDDVTGVMTAMEKSDVAFKTLLSIRSKLMEAYDEVRNIPL
jgi:flagellar hook-basal body complex protein FliE